MRTLTSRMVSLMIPSSRAPLVTAVVVGLLAAAPQVSSAQPVVVGGVAGVSRSRQILDRASDSNPRDGFVAGVWVDVQTPAPVLHVLAEAVYARRGGAFPFSGPGGVTGRVESDWLAMTVAPALHLGVGPAAVFAYGGPTLELHLRTRSAAALHNAFATPTDQSLAVTAGGGVEGRFGTWALRCEARIVESLSAAYSGNAGDVRHRSVEAVVRLGRRRSTEALPAAPPESSPAPGTS